MKAPALLCGLAGAYAAYIPTEPWSTLTPSQTATAGTRDHTAAFGILIQTAYPSASAAYYANGTDDSVGEPATYSAPGSDAGFYDTHYYESGLASETYGFSNTASNATDVEYPTDSYDSYVTDVGYPTDPGSFDSYATDVSYPTDSENVDSYATDVSYPTDAENLDSYATDSDAPTEIANEASPTDVAKRHTKERKFKKDVVNQIGDGQVQHQSLAPTASVVNQIGDGQIQHPTGVLQIADGQVQADAPAACLTDTALSLTLNNGVLTDGTGRVGAIVANYQFQFDGPPQAGTLYAAGWSISDSGHLTLGDSDLFYQCKSGDFYNLYFFVNDADIMPQCEPVYLPIVDLVSC